MAKKRRKNYWDPGYPVTLTGAGPWRESVSNPGSFYREIFVEMDGRPIGRQYVDQGMENYQQKAWDAILEELDRGTHIRGVGAIIQADDGSLSLDSDHFRFEEIIEVDR